jgi:hypothetical protein
MVVADSWQGSAFGSDVLSRERLSVAWVDEIPINAEKKVKSKQE